MTDTETTTQTADATAEATAEGTTDAPAGDAPETTAAVDPAAAASANDATSQTVKDGGGTPDVPTEQVIEVGGPLSHEHAVEFATPWHRDAYIAGLKREIEGAQIRGADDQVENAQRELDRVTGGVTPAKKPAAAKTSRTPVKRKLTRPRGAGKTTR